MSTYDEISLALNGVLVMAAIGALAVYARQLSAMRNATMAQSAIALVGFLQDQAARDARGVVRGLDGKPLAEWTNEERANASLVVANYDVAALLLKRGVAPVDLISGPWGPSITHCYAVLEPFIKEIRQKPGGHPTYWSNFDWLSKLVSEDRAQSRD